MKHFLSINDCSSDELHELLEISSQLKSQVKTGTLSKTLKGKYLAMVFEKASLRTRMSFHIAMTDLGGIPIYLKPDDIGVLGQREPVKDLSRVLGRYVHGIMARTFSHQSLIDLSEFSGVPVINALSDWSHPCQAMADMLTIKEHFGDLDGIQLAFIGDGNNVARSLAFVCSKLGCSMKIASPKGYELDDQTLQSANQGRQCLYQGHDPVDVVKGADVVYTDTWISMGQERQAQERVQTFESFQVNASLLQYAPKAKIMHCLPAHRGHEITDEIMESPNAIIFDQAENRLHFQRALLMKLLSSS